MSFVLFAALGWSLFGWVSVILKVAIGLGAVIFVHELGHFLVAKACGVKCEKFMIGFDIGGYKLSWRRGETEYGIGILPLGGYVKMLGQDDDPAHLAEQMQKSQVDAESADAASITGPDGKTYYVDRRSYLAKSVPQRMAIISAGVTMNVIFAFIFAVIAYGMGVPYVPSIVSETVPGSPAWKAGIEPGDEIVQIANTVDPTFSQLKGDVTLGDLDHGIQCRVRRTANGEVVALTLKPEQGNGHLATIGIAGPQSLTLSDLMPVIDSSSAAQAKLVSPAEGDIQAGGAKFESGDEIVRVGDIAVKNYREFTAELARQPSQPLRITVRRPLKSADGKAGQSEKDAAPATQELTFEVPTQPFNRFNFEMQMGPITSIQTDSPAEHAGLAAGDVIETVDGKKTGEGTNAAQIWTPQTLPIYLNRAAKEGREVTITVQRQIGNGKSQPITVPLKPRVPIAIDMLFPTRPLGAPMVANAIGAAYQLGNEIESVRPNTPAAANLKAGDQITSVRIMFPQDTKGGTAEPVVINLIADQPTGLAAFLWKIFGTTREPRPEPNWPTVLDAIQFIPDGTEVELTYVRGDAEPRKVTLKPVAAEDAFVAARGFWFQPIEHMRTAGSFAEQLRYGWNETSDSLTMVFRFLKKLGTQVPLSALGGPVTIAKAAGYSAAEGMSSLLVFLTVLSANLAVINLLPIPLLDGGHLVFLAYKGIRGRPANEKFVIALHTAGFVFIVGIMLYVIALDLHLFPRDL